MRKERPQPEDIQEAIEKQDWVKSIIISHQLELMRGRHYSYFKSLQCDVQGTI